MSALTAGSPDLAESLRGATTALHRRVERSPFMSTLLGGRASRAAYCALLRSLHAIYAELELALTRHEAQVVVAPVVLPALFRRSALEHDLTALHGAAWREDIPLPAAAARYAQHLARLAGECPERLVAHAYVRYLGDLSGGQLLSRVVTRTLALSGGRGTEFYDFGDAERTRLLKDAFRRGLAAVPVDSALQVELVEEAVRAFEMHAALFDELAAC